jgi:hypothetical protein
MRSLILLAPDLESVPANFSSAKLDPISHKSLLYKMERLRGKLYLEDGDIEPWQLTVDARHYQPADDHSWHLLALNDESVIGCARLQFYTRAASFSDLGVSRCAQAHDPMWGSALQNSVTRDLQLARKEGLRFAEAGGWALAPELRHTTEALRIALGCFALGAVFGGSLGLSTATFNHNSTGILQRLGAVNLTWEDSNIPPYYDPFYRCEMEVIRFDSRSPNPRFRVPVERLRTELQATPVVCARLDAAIESTSLQALSQALQVHRGEPMPATVPLDENLVLQDVERRGAMSAMPLREDL